MKTKKLAYTLARLTMGVNFFAHGLVRLPKLQGFKNWMVEYFQDSILPLWSVKIWATLLPFFEFGIGFLLILGLFTHQTLLVGASVMLFLILGSCLKENWEWVGFQMIYALYFFFLLIYVEYNEYSVENIFSKDKK